MPAYLVRVEGLLPGAHDEAVVHRQDHDLVHALRLELGRLGDVPCCEGKNVCVCERGVECADR